MNARNDLKGRPEYAANIANELELWEYLGCNENGDTPPPEV